MCNKCITEEGITEEDMDVEDGTNVSSDNYNSGEPYNYVCVLHILA